MSGSQAGERSAFLAALDSCLARDCAGVAVVRVDLDRFSRIRQVFGPSVARSVRSRLRTRLESLAGSPHYVLPYSEDAFAVIMRTEDGSREGLYDLGRRIVETVSAPLQLNGNPPIAVGSNAGIAGAEHFAEADPLRLLAGAEFAIQQADGIGSRRVVVYEVAPTDDPTRMPELFADMLCALEAQQFQPWFQPVIALADRRVYGMETVMRWMHPVHGVLRPADFIPEAERSGLIRELDAQVWEHAWRAYAREPRLRNLDIGVNLSPADVDFPGLALRVTGLLEDTGIDPQRLVFEVTETTLSQNWEHARRQLADLRTLGARVAIDDFGSGHMFLDRLATGLFNSLKIDRSLVSPPAWRAEPMQSLVLGVTELAHSLGMTVLAEGVETQEQLDAVVSAGCDYAQGYFFARPMPFDDFVAAYCV